jgi:hypothetical protein
MPFVLVLWLLKSCVVISPSKIKSGTPHGQDLISEVLKIWHFWQCIQTLTFPGGENIYGHSKTVNQLLTNRKRKGKKKMVCALVITEPGLRVHRMRNGYVKTIRKWTMCLIWVWVVSHHGFTHLHHWADLKYMALHWQCWILHHHVFYVMSFLSVFACFSLLYLLLLSVAVTSVLTHVV